MTDSIRLAVSYESQLDNASGQGGRECLSSSCAMLARFWQKVSGDDEYNRLRVRFGDTTSPWAQIQTLQHLGLVSQFGQHGSQVDLVRELRAGRPVAVGWLHKGHVSAPAGGGHWSVAVGIWPQGVLMHDPYGEALLISGGYTSNTNGAYLQYSWKNWIPRWCVDGPRSGWFITAHK